MGSSTESLTQRWLRQNIQPYAQKDTVYSHVDAVLSRFPSVRPKTDIYTYDDGRTQLLLCLHGLLPISYRGAAYNIPIAVWIAREYPRLPPIAYVVPTSDMLVRPGKFMEVSGRCQIEYILNWERKSEGCNLAALLEAMQEHFSREPPVYAKPKDGESPRPPAHAPRADSQGPDYSGRPPPPLPGTQASPSPLSRPSPSSHGSSDDRPPLPAKPGMSSLATTSRGASPAAQPPAVDRVQSPAVVGSQQSYATRPPPPPPPPQQPNDATLPQYRQSPMPPRYVTHERVPSSARAGSIGPPPPINAASHPVHPPATWVPPDGPQEDPSNRRMSMPVYSSPGPTSAQLASPVGTNPPLHAPYASPPQAPPPPPPISPPRITQPQPQAHHATIQPPFLAQQNTGSQSYAPQPPLPPPVPAPPAAASPPMAPPPPMLRPPPSLPPPDIMDAEDDLSTVVPAPTAAPAPPRPPNPELVRLHNEVHAKLSSELASLSQAMTLDAERLRALQTDLLAGEPAIRDEMARLEAVRDVCTAVGTRLRKVVDDAERNVAELKRKGDPDVDELVCSTTIVHNQLINLVAEDNAIEDTMYHLHRALNTGRIDLERFLRTTRVLAEEQFMKRALIEKILSGIPMGESALSMRPEWS